MRAAWSVANCLGLCLSTILAPCTKWVQVRPSWFYLYTQRREFQIAILLLIQRQDGMTFLALSGVRARPWDTGYESFVKIGFEVTGVSAQSASEQHDFVVRHGIQFPMLSDPTFSLATSLALPTFWVGDRRFYKRISLVIQRQASSIQSHLRPRTRGTCSTD